MRRIFNILIRWAILYAGLSSAILHAQILKDTASLNLVKKGVDYIYSLRFDSASSICEIISHTYPGHPVNYLLNGMLTYWENYPLLSTSPQRTSYENDLRRCIEVCEKRPDTANATEYLLANLCARGMLLLFYSDNDISGEVFPLAATSYKYIRKAFDHVSVYSDFHFFTGMYNYYREAYPAIHPIYKPLAFLFPRGDRVKGLKELENAAYKSIFLKAESFSFLSYIYTGFENNFREALQYIKSLHELYPRNMQYLAGYIKNLLLIKQYEEAESLIKSSAQQNSNSYYHAQLNICNGILQEKKYKDYEQAQRYYNNGIRELSNFGSLGGEFSAYGYFGLSRLSDLKGDRANKKLYRKKAVELAEFKNIDLDN